jgi:hypothetical protein
MTETQPTKTFWATTWEKIKVIFSWMGRYLIAPGVALLVVIGAVLLVAMGFKELQIGGLLGRLFGKKDPESKSLEVINTPPPDRIDKEGKIIPPGTPDSKGQTQALVVPIEEPGLFSNPNVIKFTPPGETKPREVKLPDGVKAKDVDHVVIVSPTVTAITVKDSSGVTTKNIDDLLSKYD